MTVSQFVAFAQNFTGWPQMIERNFNFTFEQILEHLDKTASWEKFIYSGKPYNWPNFTILRTPNGFALFEREERSQFCSVKYYETLREVVIEKINRIAEGRGLKFLDSRS